MAFDIAYLFTALLLGIFLLTAGTPSTAKTLAGAAALVLAGGDAFHLLPRIRAIRTGQPERHRRAMGLGKLVTSLTMTLFYVLLFHVGRLLFEEPLAEGWTALVYLLALTRTALCLFPQNRWMDGRPASHFGIWRNVPFVLLGAVTAVLFIRAGAALPPLRWMWLAIALSFFCYLPVVLWADRQPKLGMLMLPKTCAYVWMLCLLASLSS